VSAISCACSSAPPLERFGVDASNLRHSEPSRTAAYPALYHVSGPRITAAEDFLLVTNNTGDFRRLPAAQPLHAGLVILSRNSTARCNAHRARRAMGGRPRGEARR
jgi:hypothetical protein